MPSVPSASSVLPAIMGLGAIKPSLLGSENKHQRADDADGADANAAAFVLGSRQWRLASRGPQQE
jgi:hypothetical protein